MNISLDMWWFYDEIWYTHINLLMTDASCYWKNDLGAYAPTGGLPFWKKLSIRFFFKLRKNQYHFSAIFFLMRLYALVNHNHWERIKLGNLHSSKANLFKEKFKKFRKNEIFGGIAGAPRAPTLKIFVQKKCLKY